MSILAHRLLLGCALLAALGAASARGQAPSPSPPSPPPAGGRESAALQDCHVAVDQAGRYATFQAQMTALPHTLHMAIRIDLQEHASGVPGFRVVAAAGLGVWRRSAEGVKIYRYVKQVTNLPAPAVFRAVIRYRWLGPGDTIMRRATRRTDVCVQPDERPLLAVGAVTVTAPMRSPAAQYSIVVRNRGRGPAPGFEVTLTVNGATQPPLAVSSLAAASHTVLDALAPPCAAGSQVQIDLDPQHLIDEATRGGLSKTVPCPLASASGAAAR